MLCGEDPDSDSDDHIDLDANDSIAAICSPDSHASLNSDVRSRVCDSHKDNCGVLSVQASDDAGVVSCASSAAHGAASTSQESPGDAGMSEGDAACIRAAMSTFDLPAPDWARGLDVSVSKFLASRPTASIYDPSSLLPFQLRLAYSSWSVPTFNATMPVISDVSCPDLLSCLRCIYDPTQNATLLEQVGSVLQQRRAR